MAQNTARSYKIDRLSDSNYQPWRMTMEIILEKQELLGVVDGSIPNPGPADAAALADWNKKDLSARLELLLHMEDSQKQSMRMLKTAHEIWARLQTSYQRTDVSSRVNLLKKLVNLTMQETSDVPIFIKDWRNALDDVSLAGLTLPEDLQATLLLAALPTSWQPFISTKSTANLTVPLLVPSIMQEHALRMPQQTTTTTSSNPHLAMFSRSSSFRHRTSRPSSRVPSQSTSSWRSRPSSSYQRPSSSRPPFHVKKAYCRKCRVYGHTERNCYRNFSGKKFFRQAHYVSNSPSEHESEPEDVPSSPSSASQSSQASEEDAHLCFMADSITSPLPANVPESSWLLDTGATCNLTSDRRALHHYRTLKNPFPVRFGNNSRQYAVGFGTAHILLSDGNVVAIPKVYHIPQLAKNLISVSQIAKSGTRVEFEEGHAIIKHVLPSGARYRVLGPKIGQLYILGSTQISNECYFSSPTPDPDYTTLLWHYRLGHLHHGAMKTIYQHHLAKHYSLPKHSRLSLCEGCIFGKMPNKQYPTSTTSTHRPLELIHSDLCGPLPVPSLTQNLYFITFIDDYTRFTMVSFTRDKTSATILNQFKTFHRLAENQLEQPIKSLQTDNGGEYTSHAFEAYCSQYGIHHRLTVAHNPQQNGLAERKNRSLMNSARSMLRVAGLSPSFWEEAVATACYLQNRT